MQGEPAARVLAAAEAQKARGTRRAGRPATGDKGVRPGGPDGRATETDRCTPASGLNPWDRLDRPGDSCTRVCAPTQVARPAALCPLLDSTLLASHRPLPYLAPIQAPSIRRLTE